MKNILKLFLFIYLVSIQITYAQVNFWRGQSKENINRSKLVERRKSPSRSIQLQLNNTSFINYLTDNNRKEKILKFPNAEGNFEDYIIKEETSLHPDLQKKYSTIKSYSGINIKDANEKIYLSYSPYFGLFGNIISQNKNIIIDPFTEDLKSYVIYNKSDLKINADEFICHTEQENKTIALGVENLNFRTLNSNNNYLKKYRLAVATTTEYSDFIIERAGVKNGTVNQKKEAILAAINISINRINGILKNDAGIILELIPDNDKLLFIDTDTYETSNAYQMIDENVVVINNIIGVNNYDLGHLFFKVNNDRFSSGLANTPAVCIDNAKAGGVTGTITPIGDPFDIDYTAHEIGHQLGALHTQNNSCFRSAYGVEPGSGSTIMAYAGICEPNIQSNSDAYFHSKSIEQINSTTALSAHNCAIKVPVNNTSPTILSTNKNYFIPHSTAFSLNLDATDNEDKNLTYTWEQIDYTLGEIMPPVSSNTRGPMFRSFIPSTNSERYFPRLEKILNNEIVFTTNYYNEAPNLYHLNNWEVVPNNKRTLNFRGSVRDNNPEIGLIASIDQAVNIEASGPFIITSQNTDETWNIGDNKTITWNVANTNQFPINTSFVKILLSTDGGLTWDKTIAESAPNTGIFNYNVANNLGKTEKARLMIKAIDNIFLAVNSTNFTINSNLSTVDNISNQENIYPNPTNGWINIKLQKSISNLKIEIYDLTGRKILTKTSPYQNNEHKFQLSELSNGIYILKYNYDDEEKTQKIIIKK